MKLNFGINLFAFIFILILLFIFPASVYPQDLDITPYLKKIEAGEKEEVNKTMPGLKQKYPSSSSVIYLEALLNEDGEQAFQIYKSIVDKYPHSKYADDSIYRIYSYFYAIDNTSQAKLYLNRLKTEYPESPYIKLTEQITFAEKTQTTVKTEESKAYPKVNGQKVEKEYKFTVQAGAFTRKENALKLKSDFDKAGYSSEIKEKIVGGSLFHVIYIGKFYTEEEAKSFLNLINSKFNLQAWVVKPE
jgi:hypothetical protein